MPKSLLGQIPVRTDMTAVEAFRAALGAQVGAGTPVPYTFPIAWMNAPSVRSAIERHLDARGVRPGAILMHLEQSISYRAVLAPDTDYVLSIHVAIDAGTERITLEAAVMEPYGEEICRLESGIALLRLEDGQ